MGVFANRFIDLMIMMVRYIIVVIIIIIIIIETAIPAVLTIEF